MISKEIRNSVKLCLEMDAKENFFFPDGDLIKKMSSEIYLKVIANNLGVNRIVQLLNKFNCAVKCQKRVNYLLVQISCLQSNHKFGYVLLPCLEWLSVLKKTLIRF